MRIFLLVFILIWCVSCSTHVIQSPGVNATSTAFLYCPEALVLQIDGKKVSIGAESAGVGAVVQALGHEAAGVIKT